MKHIITLLSVLTIFGCQTAKETINYNFEPKPKSITLLVEPENPYKETNVYSAQLNVKTVDGKMCCPRVIKLANQWGTTSSGVDIQGYNYKTKALIGDELVEIDCEPGMRATMKVVPLESGKMQVKGMYVYNRIPEKGLITVPATVIPFNVVVNVGEETTIYEMNMDFEPTR